MPVSLNCPTCGAPAAAPDASRCDYCGSTLRSMACPSCFGSMFAGMQFCPHCGAKGDRVVDDTATLPCPGCRGEMTRVRIGATTLFECASCSSTWLDTDTFSHLCLDREERGAIAALVGARDAGITPTRSTVRYLPCPVCKTVMNRENFGKRSGVIIDVCKGHGVWFEERELPMVMAFIDRGGLERARTLEAARAEGERRQARTRGAGGSDALRNGITATDTGASSFIVHRMGSASSPAAAPADSLLVEALRFLFN